MPMIWKTLALAGTAALGLTAGQADAREYIEKGDLKIYNKSSGERKVCVFKYEKINIIPQKCFRLKPDHWVVWTRPNPKENFRVSVTEVRKGFDKLLRTPTLPANTVYIAVGNNNSWTQSVWRPPAGPPPPAYRVKYCNVSQPGKVWLAVGAISNVPDNQAVMTVGYWGISKGDCTTINYTQILEDTGVKLSGRVPQMMYRAYTTGENARRWEGAEATEDPIFCVNTQTKFRISHLTGNGIEMRPCEGQNEAMKRFIWAPTLDRQVQIGRVNF